MCLDLNVELPGKQANLLQPFQSGPSAADKEEIRHRMAACQTLVLAAAIEPVEVALFSVPE